MNSRNKERREAQKVHLQAYKDILAEVEEATRPYQEALEKAGAEAAATFQAKSAMIWQIYIEAIARIDEKYRKN